MRLEIQCLELEDEISKMNDLLRTSKQIQRDKSRSPGKKGRSRSKKKGAKG